MYSKVLFPTDGSDDAAAALEHALDLAGTYDATLHALYVEPPDDAAGVLPEDEQEPPSGDQILEAVSERGSDAGVPVVGDVLHGDPSTVILEYAAEEGIDLIVMATRGRTGLDRYILGSVTEDVVRSAPVPVLTVRMADA